MAEFYGTQNLDKNELFELFKENEGVEYVDAIKKNVVSLCFDSERTKEEQRKL